MQKMQIEPCILQIWTEHMANMTVCLQILQRRVDTINSFERRRLGAKLLERRRLSRRARLYRVPK